MMIADRVMQTATGVGLGSLQLFSVPPGMRSFASAFPDGAEVVYCIEDANGAAWEIGAGTLSTGGPVTLTRDSLRSSSTGEFIELTNDEHLVFATVDALFFSPESSIDGALRWMGATSSGENPFESPASASLKLASTVFQTALRLNADAIVRAGSPDYAVPYTFTNVSNCSLNSDLVDVWNRGVHVFANAPSGNGEAFWEIDLDVTNYTELRFRWRNPDSNNGEMYRVIKLGDDVLVETKSGPAAFTEVAHDLSQVTGVKRFSFGFRLDGISFSASYDMWLDDLRLVK